jgi:hypothetical protein
MIMNKHSLSLGALTGLLCAAVTLTVGDSVRADTEGQRHLAGTWIITVTPALPPGVPPLTFTEMITFEVGGGLTETNTVLNPQSGASPILPPPATGLTGSDGHGNWKRVSGDHEFAYTFRKLLFAGPVTDPVFGPVLFTGQHIGAFTAQALFSIRREGENEVLEGTFTAQFRNLQDAVVGTASGTFTGRRLAVEPLATVD